MSRRRVPAVGDLALTCLGALLHARGAMGPHCQREPDLIRGPNDE